MANTDDEWYKEIKIANELFDDLPKKDLRMVNELKSLLKNGLDIGNDFEKFLLKWLGVLFIIIMFIFAIKLLIFAVKFKGRYILNYKDSFIIFFDKISDIANKIKDTNSAFVFSIIFATIFTIIYKPFAFLKDKFIELKDFFQKSKDSIGN